METKVQEELAVCREFAAVAAGRLLMQPETIEHRDPPEPDILCQISGRGPIAFELVSIEDIVRYRPNGNSDSVRSVDDPYNELTAALGAAYWEAVDDRSIVSPERFDFQTVRVDFQVGATLRQRRRAVPRVVELLNTLGPGKHPINENVIRSIRCEKEGPPIRQQPSFAAGSTFSNVGNATVENIRGKLGKSYETEHPIHLLAWSDTASKDEMPRWQGDLEALLAESMGQFEHIWVYGRVSNEIIYDFGPRVGLGFQPAAEVR